MRVCQRTYVCLAINMIGLVGMCIYMMSFANMADLCVYGPAPDLVVMTVVIDTWSKYIGLVGVVVIARVLEVLVNDIGSPAMGFQIFDPTKTTVYGFTSCTLQLAANGMWMVNGLSSIIKTLLIVSRLDMAMISIVSSELASIITVRFLLGNKQFIPEFDTVEEASQLHHVVCDIVE